MQGLPVGIKMKISLEKCHIFVRNINKTVCLLITTSIKGQKQEEAIHLPKRFQWAISVSKV